MGDNIMRRSGSPEQSDQAQSDWQIAECWARRAMWLLIAVTSLWDILVTFDRHFELTARLF